MTEPVTWWDFLLGALALTLVVEGLVPFFNPQGWRRAFERALQLSDGQLRFVGLLCMLVGAIAFAALTL